MLRGKDVHDIRELQRQGLSLSDIHTLTGYDPKTICKYLDNPQPPRYGARANRVPAGSMPTSPTFRSVWRQACGMRPCGCAR